ncbi:MAG: NUDIX domain-containing protein [Bacilli bacterium]
MYRTYQDYFSNSVELWLGEYPGEAVDHVLGYIRQGEHWLCTIHRSRGLEFPGGHIESGETAEEALCREVLEECAVKIKNCTYVGYYKVQRDGTSFTKGIYHAEVDQILEPTEWLETCGRMFVKNNELLSPKLGEWSFIMKDETLQTTLKWLYKSNIITPFDIQAETQKY